MQDLFDWFQQQLTAKEQEVETGHQVSHTEDADACGARSEDDGEDKPEQVAKYNDLQHVKVGSGRQWRKNKKSYEKLFSMLFPAGRETFVSNLIISF